MPPNRKTFLQRQPFRLLVLAIGWAIAVFFFAATAIVFYEIFSSSIRRTNWSEWKRIAALVFGVITAVLALAVTSNRLTRKYGLSEDLQFAVLFEYLVALLAWGVLCGLPLYLFLLR